MSDLRNAVDMGERRVWEWWWMSCWAQCKLCRGEHRSDEIAYEKVVFCVVKDHIDGLVFEDDFAECNDVFVANLPVKLQRRVST
jgi:hypothetical protein